MNAFLRLLFVIVVAGVCYWLLNNWALPAIGLPQPFDKLAHVVLIILVCALILDGLLGLMSKNFIKWY
jgi:hypothetical protein